MHFLESETLYIESLGQVVVLSSNTLDVLLGLFVGGAH